MVFLDVRRDMSDSQYAAAAPLIEWPIPTLFSVVMHAGAAALECTPY